MSLGRDNVVAEIVARLSAAGAGGVVRAEGTWGSFAPLLVAHMSKELARPILYIRPHIDDADKATDDLAAFDAKDIWTLPAWEGEERSRTPAVVRHRALRSRKWHCQHQHSHWLCE